MVYILDKDGVFELKESQQGEGAGTGVFCVDKVEAGTILPYYAVTFKERESDDLDRTYVMSAEYTNAKGVCKEYRGYSTDGNPKRSELVNLDQWKLAACQINEASVNFEPNCLYVTNPDIHREEIKGSFSESVPIPVTYVVVIRDMAPGEELLTCYGNEYGSRDYTPAKLGKRRYRAMVDEAYGYVEGLVV